MSIKKTIDEFWYNLQSEHIQSKVMMFVEEDFYKKLVYELSQIQRLAETINNDPTGIVLFDKIQVRHISEYDSYLRELGRLQMRENTVKHKIIRLALELEHG